MAFFSFYPLRVFCFLNLIGPPLFLPIVHSHLFFEPIWSRAFLHCSFASFFGSTEAPKPFDSRMPLPNDGPCGSLRVAFALSKSRSGRWALQRAILNYLLRFSKSVNHLSYYICPNFVLNRKIKKFGGGGSNTPPGRPSDAAPRGQPDAHNHALRSARHRPQHPPQHRRRRAPLEHQSRSNQPSPGDIPQPGGGGCTSWQRSPTAPFYFQTSPPPPGDPPRGVPHGSDPQPAHFSPFKPAPPSFGAPLRFSWVLFCFFSLSSQLFPPLRMVLWSFLAPSTKWAFAQTASSFVLFCLL